MADKKDTGIIPELGITEEKRDELAKRDWSKPSSLASENPSNWSTKECQEKRFSGIRTNSFTGMTEIWVTGQIRMEKSTQLIADNPSLLADMHEEVFMTNGSIVGVDLVHKTIKLPEKDPRRR